MREVVQASAPVQETLARAPMAADRAPAALLQRACACGGTPGPDGECAACKAKRLGLQRRAAAPGPQVAPPIVHGVLRGAGRPLDPAVRGEMEARFGHDFSRVRVHADTAAAESARAVSAHAYTVGSDVVFGSGRYEPRSASGAELLAHELTHVVQQRDASSVPAVLPVAPADDALERAADANTHTASVESARVQRQDIGDTRFRREDVLGPTPTQAGQVWTGTLDRQEVQEQYRRIPGPQPHDAWQATRVTPRGQMTLEYDEAACELRIPSRLVFHNPGPGQLPSADPCNTNSSTPRAPLATSDFTSLRTAFTNTVNERLNGWYRLSLEGCGAGSQCAGGVSIRVVATDTTSGGGGSGPSVDVFLINASGRSCAQPVAPEAAFIYAPGGDTGRAMWAHEGGHFALHYGDEYNEAPNPSGRVQEADYSGMASRSMSSLALLHERHFSFAPAFVNQVMQASGRSCRATLRELSRPTVLVVSETLSGGAFWGSSGTGEYVDLGLQFGVPMTRLRDWQGIIGAHARLLVGLDGTRQIALLGGIRIGLERNITLSRFGYILNTGIYGEGGAGAFDLGGRNEAHPYGEVGGYASLRFQQLGSVVPFVGVEAGAGGRLDLPGQIGGPGGGVPEPPTSAGPVEWRRFGIWIGLQH